MKRSTLNRIGLLFVALVMVSPVVLFFLWMISLSLKYEIDNGAYPPILIPDRFAWSNYVQVFQEKITARISATTIPGLAIGRATSRKICQEFAPSMLAASSSSMGVASK